MFVPLFSGVPVVVSIIVYFSVLFTGFLEFGTVCRFPLFAGFGTVFCFWSWVCNAVSTKQLNIMIQKIKLHAKKNPTYLLEIGLCLFFVTAILVTVLILSFQNY